MKKKKKSNFITIFLVLILLAGLSLLLYPTFSDYWNSFHQSRAIASYSDAVEELDEEDYEAFWQAAVEYNKEMASTGNRFSLSEEEEEEYNKILDITGTGIMGYVEIPSIQCSLPIYHGTDEAVLQIAAGHIEGTSLPVGGEGSHCVISGHRGLPSAKLFTDLDQLVEGDVFMLRVMDEVLTYEVDQILIVEPYDLDALQIEDGKDYCTLVTCTPYGVNTHRLLVRGHRIENIEDSDSAYVTADAIQIEPLIVAPIVAVPMLLILLIIVLLPKRRKGKGGKSHEKR